MAVEFFGDVFYFLIHWDCFSYELAGNLLMVSERACLIFVDWYE